MTTACTATLLDKSVKDPIDMYRRLPTTGADGTVQEGGHDAPGNGRGVAGGGLLKTFRAAENLERDASFTAAEPAAPRKLVRHWTRTQMTATGISC